MSRGFTTFFRLATFVLLGGLVGACTAPAPRAPEIDAPLAIQAIETLRTTLASTYTLGNAGALAALYTSDAVTMRAGQPSATGRQAILDTAQAFFSAYRVRIDITPDETHTQDAEGWERGRYRMRLTPKAGGDPVFEDGRYMVLLERTDEGWRIARDLSNVLPAAGR